MERIGIAASKIAKGNLLLYNLIVVSLSLLFSLLVYFVAGSVIIIVLILVAYLINGGAFPDLEQEWFPIMRLSMISLAVLVGICTLYAILRNARFRKKREK